MASASPTYGTSSVSTSAQPITMASASPTYGTSSVSTSAQPIKMATPTLDPRAKSWTPPDMAVAPAPILALSSAALTAKPATTDTSAHEHELMTMGAVQGRKNVNMRMKQLIREITNTEKERQAMRLAPLQHDIDSIPACCHTCGNVRRLKSILDVFSGRLKIKVFAGDANETDWDAQFRQATGLPTLMEDADASPTDCPTCGNKQLLKLLLLRRPGDLKILIVASNNPGFCNSTTTSTESNLAKGGKVVAGRYVTFLSGVNDMSHS